MTEKQRKLLQKMRTEKSNFIERKASEIICTGRDRGVLIDEIVEYYVRYVLRVEPIVELAEFNLPDGLLETSFSGISREGYNSLKLFEAIVFAVENYDPNTHPGVSLMQYVGSIVKIRKSDIMPKFVDEKLLEPQDKVPPKPIQDYYKILKALRKLEIDIKEMTDADISEVCELVGIKKEDFNSILRAVATTHPISLSTAGDTDDGETLELQISDNFAEQELVEFKIWLFEWFVWLAQNGAIKKQYTYKMINTNWIMNKNFYPSEFSFHIDNDYYNYAFYLDYTDKTIIVFLNNCGFKTSHGGAMTKENFSPTYRKPYNEHLLEYVCKDNY